MPQVIDLIRRKAAFDPETVNILTGAFENAWQSVQASGERLAQPAYASATREVIAKYIIDMAQRGERDPGKLSDGAVEFLATNYNP